MTNLELYLIIAASILGLWVLWKTRRIIWFILLFVVALAAILAFNIGLKFAEDEIRYFAEGMLVFGAIYGAYKFAKKRA